MCIFCEKHYSKLPRHLEKMHIKEIEVARAFAFNKKSKERKQALERIRKKGMKAHNIAVLRNGKGSLQITKRPCESNASYLNYGLCTFCDGVYLKKDLWRHQKHCSSKTTSSNSKTKKDGNKVALSSLECSSRYGGEYPQSFMNIVTAMNRDDIASVCISDRVIMDYGLRKFKRKGHDPAQHNYIRAKMRELGRFLKQARTHGVKSMDLILRASQFPLVEKVVKEILALMR